MIDATDDAHALPPISANAPCGLDLDSEGDRDFLNFIAQWEGQLPAPGKFYEFKRDSIDIAEALRGAEKLLARTRDIRLLALVAKLSILNQDVPRFARELGRVGWLLRTYWEEVHPKAEDGDFGLRMAQLNSLEDNATVLLPLQYATLFVSNREGALTYRAQMVATGAAGPRVVTKLNERGQQETSAAEKLMPGKSIERLLQRDIEIEQLAGICETLRDLVASVQSIKSTTIERVGEENASALPKLEKLAREMLDFILAALIKRDPSRAPAVEPPTEGEASSPEAGVAAPLAFTTLANVDAALSSALGYFAASEPSSPAVLMIRQARETLGKNLYEVMKLLAPAHADNARVFVGPDSVFTVPVKSLSTSGGVDFKREPTPAANSRAAALALIDSVAVHMRHVEPSSPAPYLLDRAKNLATRDFLTLLQELLSDEAIAAMKKGK